MAQEEHRAPARIASVRSSWVSQPPPASTQRRPTRPVEVDYDVIDAVTEEEENTYQDYTASVETQHRAESRPYPSRVTPPPPPPEPAPREPVREYEVDEPSPAVENGEMNTQEQYQLLLHNIQLCDDEWKLAGIRANEKNNWLTAYLIPRTKQMELKTAISRNQVLIITIDNHGNTDIKEPKKRGFWRHLTSWLYGD